MRKVSEFVIDKNGPELQTGFWQSPSYWMTVHIGFLKWLWSDAGKDARAPIVIR